MPNNALLAVVGDVARDEALAAAREGLRRLGAGRRAGLQATIEPPEPTRRVVVIDQPDAVQTEIRVGTSPSRASTTTTMALDLAVKILGGEGANRLQHVLRSERGADLRRVGRHRHATRWRGAIVAETDTQTSSTGEALRVIVDEFSRLQRERVNDASWRGAQAYLVGHFPLTIETPDAIATQVLNQLFYELPVDDLPTYRERVLAVTPDEIQRVAR